MAVDVTLNDVTSGFSRSLINDNFQLIETALQDALSRSGSSPNTMSADIDLNSNDLINVGTVNTAELKVAGVTVTDATYVPDWKGPWATSTAYVINDLISEAGSTYICLEAHTSGTFSTDLTANKWELFAQQGTTGDGTGDMLAANNLSDVANVATSRSNLGLGDMATQNKASVEITGGDITGAVVDAATTSSLGVVELATEAEGTVGTDSSRTPPVSVVKSMIDERQGSTLFQSKQVLSADTQIDFVLVPGVDEHIFTLRSVRPDVGGSHMNVAVSDDGKSTFEDINYEIIHNLGQTTTTFATMNIGSNIRADRGSSGKLIISQLSGEYAALKSDIVTYNSTATAPRLQTSNGYAETTNELTDIRFSVSNAGSDLLNSGEIIYITKTYA